MNWDDLRPFLALARHGSIRAAGASLGISHTTISRRVEELEEQLGARLFDRHRDGYRLTEAGRNMLAAAERVEVEVNALERAFTGRDARLEGPVHVTCSDHHMAGLLLADLAPWCAANPGVDLTLTTDGRTYNLARGEADLAVRVLGLGASPPESLVGHRLGPLVCASYVALAHAARLEPPAPEARWLGFTDTRVTGELVRTGSFPDLPIWGAFNALGVLIHAAVEGLGLAILPRYAGDSEPQLRRLSVPDDRVMGELWLLYHPDLRQTVRVQAVRAVIREGFARRFGPGGMWFENAPEEPKKAT